jgi:hypothetical protein
MVRLCQNALNLFKLHVLVARLDVNKKEVRKEVLFQNCPVFSTQERSSSTPNLQRWFPPRFLQQHGRGVTIQTLRLSNTERSWLFIPVCHDFDV